MTDKELATLRRRYRLEKNNIDTLYGCYINDQKEIVTRFKHFLPSLTVEEADRYLGLLRRAMVGSIGKNLIPISFSGTQVTDGKEHKLLSALRSSALKDEEAVDAFFDTVRNHLETDGNYLILLAHDVFDVPSFTSDGEKDTEGSDSLFSYILCAVCPIKLTKPSLCYDAFRALFQNKEADQIVGAPELGVLFPAFEDGGANIYQALYYTRDLSNNHGELAKALFGEEKPLPLPAKEQKNVFDALLESGLQEECSYDVVQTVQDRMIAWTEAQKDNEPGEELPPIGKQDIERTLTQCGVSEEKVREFDRRYDETIGEQNELCAQNLTNKGKIELCTEDVTVRLNADKSDLVQTRLLDGTPCIVIRAEGVLTVNGVAVKIRNQEAKGN